MIVLDCDGAADEDALAHALLDFAGLSLDAALLRRLERFARRFLPGATAEAVRGVGERDRDTVYLAVRCRPGGGANGEAPELSKDIRKVLWSSARD